MPEYGYMHPNFRVLREEFASNVAVGTNLRFRPTNPIKIKQLRGVVTTAGTATTATAILRAGAAGTTAIGTATMGTGTAGASFALTGLDAAVAANDLVNVLTAGGVSCDLSIAFYGDSGAAQIV